MKDITNINDKGLYHGYQEWYYTNGNLGYKCLYNNGIRVDYEEYHSSDVGLKKTFYI